MKPVLLSFFLFVFTSFSQDIETGQSGVKDEGLIGLVKNIEKYNDENPVEKVYLHVDRDIAFAGDDLWYSAYLTLGAYHNFSDASKVLYVDLINSGNEVVISQTQRLVNGRCNGSMKIPKELPQGNYRLRAYTKWMTNYDPGFFFYKTITIIGKQLAGNPSPSLNDKIDLRFFPEGGQLVENIPCRMAFKAIGDDGSGKMINGRIVDATDRIICDMDSTPQGFGFFHLLPETGNTYKAILDDGSTYDLPATIEKGYSMSVNNLDFEKIKVRISASDSFKDRPFYIVGTIRNRKYFEAKFAFNQDSFFDFEIPKDDLFSGVLTITLFDENKRPRCERLVFIDNQQKFKVKVTPNTGTFTKRGPISLRINVIDEEDKPVPTQLSISIADARYIEKNEYGRNILTYLLLESDMKGHIDYPNFFFKDKERSTLLHLDMVMMTHGWRRYKWQDIVNGIDQSKKNQFEKGITVSGTAYGRDERPLANTLIKMIGLSETDFFAYPTKTTDSGYLEIHNVDFRDSLRVMFNAYNKKNKKIDADIILDQNNIFPIGKLDNYNMGISKKEEIDSFRGTNYNRRVDDSIIDNVTELDEVVVTEQRIIKKESPSVYGIVPDAVVYQDENNPKDLSLLLSTLPGVLVSGDIGSPDTKVSIRGGISSFTSSSEPLWIVDGSILSAREGSYNPIPFLERSIVERIEVLKGPSASAFGARGSNGVILVYTRRGKPSSTSPTPNSNFEFVLAHSGEKEFYNPDYDEPNNEQEKPDYRKTLFWNPSVNTDDNGEATITFFNSDFAKQIHVVIDFLTEHGDPGFYINTFPTRE